MHSACKAHDGLLVAIFCVALLHCTRPASAQFVAFWDHAASTNQAQTHTNASLGNALYTFPISRSLQLTNITNGVETPVSLIISNFGFDPSGVIAADAEAQVPAPGTPLFTNFYYTTIDPHTSRPTNYSYVYFGQSSNDNSIKLTNASMTYVFCGVNAAARYSVRGGAVRGGVASYSNRWTLVEITGAKSFTPIMSSNVLTSQKVGGLASNQVAVNFARNHTPETGDMVGWDDIDPGSDGTFSIVCSRYTGTVPGGSSAGTFAYTITGFRVEEKILDRVKLGLQTNGAVQLSWTVPTGTIQRSTNLADWSDCTLTNGSVITPAGKWFYRLRK
jgi:hypothetical protein